MLYISACGTRSGIVECCVIFFWVWNILSYCGFLCYICLRLELALVLWNVVLYLSARGTCLVLWNILLYLSVCGTRSGIVEFLVIFICMWNALWYCRILCYIFPCIEIFGWEIKLLFVHVCCIFVLLLFLLYLSRCVKIASLSDLAYSAIYLKDFWSDSK